MPAAWKNSAISSASGALPDTQNRSRPPRAARSFANTSRSASAFCTRRPAGSGRPSCSRRLARRPTDSAQWKMRWRTRRCGRHPGEDLRVHLLEHARHAAEEVRRDLPQVLRKPLDALGERGGQAEADPEEALHPGEGVREREEEEMDVALAHPGGSRDHVERGQVVRVRLHDALRGARGPGGVHDRRDVPGFHGLEARLQRTGEMRPAAQRPERLPVEHAKTGVAPAARPAASDGSVDQDDGLETRHLRRGGKGLPELLLVLDEQGARLRVPGDVGEGLRRVRGIHRDRDAAHRQDREIRSDPLPPGLGEDPHRVSRLAPQSDQAERDLPHLLAKRPPRHVAPGSVDLDTLRCPLPGSRYPVPEESSQGLWAHGWLPPSSVMPFIRM